MIHVLFAHLRNLLGGGASYIFAGLVAALLFQHWQVKELRSDNDAVKEARDMAMAQIQEKDSLIASQSQQFKRQSQSRKDEAHAEDIINSVPDSDHCARSASINSALDWLREHEGGIPETDDDDTNVSVPGKTKSAN